MSEELKPCECGCLLRTIKHDIRGFYVCCANGHSTQYYKTEQQAISAWNRRK